MGSSCETKGTISVRVKMTNVKFLQPFSSLVKGTKRVTFSKKYGSILNLLELNVQVEAISTLA